MLCQIYFEIAIGGACPSFYYAQPSGKPGSVVDGHLSSTPVAGHIKRISSSLTDHHYCELSLQQAGFTSPTRHRARL